MGRRRKLVCWAPFECGTLKTLLRFKSCAKHQMHYLAFYVFQRSSSVWNRLYIQNQVYFHFIQFLLSQILNILTTTMILFSLKIVCRIYWSHSKLLHFFLFLSRIVFLTNKYYWPTGPPTNGIDNAPNGALGDPGLYENLPFHGLQQPPNKVRIYSQNTLQNYVKLKIIL